MIYSKFLGFSHSLIYNLSAEYDGIISPLAGENTSGIIIRVAIGCGASFLENLRIIRRLANLRIVVGSGAAELRLIESQARTFTGHRVTTTTIGPHPQFLRALQVQVGAALDG